MSSKRRLRRVEERLKSKACTGKTPYDTVKQATATKYWLMETKGIFVSPYKCPHCGKYHVGHSRQY